MRKRARANPGRKHETFDAIVQIYERAPLEFLKQVLPERYLVFPPRVDRCTLCAWDVGKKEHASPANRALMLQRYRKTHRFVPFEEYRRIDDFTKDQLRAIVARLREAHKEHHANILDLFRREKFVTPKR
jgi:hypothetical protein